MDMDEILERVNPPSIAMIVLGILNILFWLAWTVYALFFIVVGGGFQLFVMLPQALEALQHSGSSALGAIFGMLWGPLIQSCTCGVDIGMAIGSVLMIAAGIKLRSLSGKGIIFLGVAAGILGPIISIILGLMASVASFSCCGVVFGQLPTLIVLILNTMTGIWVVLTTLDEEVAEAFEANA